MRKRLLLLICFISFGSQAQVKLAKIFADHVVLQRQKPIPVWGWAKPGEKVNVTLAGQTQQTKANAQGKWMVRFSPLEAGGPYALQASAKSGNQHINDVLIGEVWLCSGQSNMEWPVERANQFEKEKKDADYPQIRHFKVEYEFALSPQEDLKTGEWQVCSPATVGGFTAVGFFFARELYQKLKVPIGLLHSSWGGSDVESWLSKEAMLSEPELNASAQRLPKTWSEADTLMEKEFRQKFYGDKNHQPTLADEAKYLNGKGDFSKWISIQEPFGQWLWKGLTGFQGWGYMSRSVDVPADLVAKPTTLALGDNDTEMEVYLNGKRISEGISQGIRTIQLPANTWKTGQNELVIKLQKRKNPDWYGLGLLGTNQDYYLSDGVTKLELIRDWKIAPSLVESHRYVPMVNRVATSIYNAKLAPLIPFGIRGALWYQGESNAGRSYQYRKSFPLMINDWRKRWNEAFPFYYVQLSSYGPDQSSNQGSGWAELREAQTLTLQFPHTGMAVTTDIGNAQDIHPTNKQDVGHRLAVIALHNDYSQSGTYSSPMFDQLSVTGNKAIVSFKFAEQGLMAKDKYGYVKGFEIAGPDKVFYYAQAHITGNKIEVSHPKVTQPVAVRYAWSDAPVDANVFSTDGFPLSSFRSDDWPGVTITHKYEK
ncbi:sialate O-acetylesterase [Siphonobacter sp. SORGH_AS_0500]|uniref:sialate O-acetylesterase n=1 Tax=Siphonobacter sp. SORGH_AS_0500 TaxID=1864824 RepID=UPI00285C3394|nr:sialate O-acetylesterase [Siphonobacter sp. SORGH_AS_0500]MDR6197285.1 sialate O-acetylesterase [Siphonobacter sp. SORGH_AS_0500]